MSASKPPLTRNDGQKAVPMDKLDSKNRKCSFSEVALGYTEEQALREAQRCLTCKKPQCVEGCPV
jgi:glutamate synthase (NADPH/NADH) small chain